MKSRIIVVSTIVLSLAISVFAQDSDNSESNSRPRVIVTDELAQPTPTPAKIVIGTEKSTSMSPTPKPTPYVVPNPDNKSDVTTANSKPSQNRHFSYGQIKQMIEEAKREMQTRPISTASVESLSLTDVVKLAFYDWNSKSLDYVVVPKKMFLSSSEDYIASTSAGKDVTVRTIRGNGVNTPVIIFDQNNVPQLPLLVQYPREDRGVLQNIAFYVSTHPGIVTPEVVNAGKLYVRNTIDIARENLKKKGEFISPQVTDMAERLAAVEHIDHWRFRNEYHPNVFNDVFALFALNEGETYKYSVSSAGAGGMVQMIPSTYRMMRSLYPQIGLMPDFVDGMRNHVNASEAMLLYMQMTWNDLVSSETVYQALQSGIATPAELMSAGYNSNPAKLPGYIKRGGADWKTLIPRETKIYLEINESFDKHFPFQQRTK